MAEKNQRGFSLLELVVVIGIVMVIAAMAVPSALSTVRRYQLESSARNAASILIRARYEAVRLNRRVNTIYIYDPTTTNPPVYGVDEGGPGPLATTVPDGALQATEPQMPLSPAVQIYGPPTWVPPGATTAPTWDAATAGSNYAATTPVSGPNFQVSFGPVGTVIQQIGGTTGPWVEANQVYVIYLQHSLTKQWAAVTVTPAGRFRVWFWSGTAWAS